MHQAHALNCGKQTGCRETVVQTETEDSMCSSVQQAHELNCGKSDMVQGHPCADTLVHMHLRSRPLSDCGHDVWQALLQDLLG